ncbi:hypothetical protein SpiGrapes_1258 [Sphaerochaeta pleomorpha str. Grapes]|uniref:3-oxo-tetronate kinase n=1 Tax=Sphaerochaeta pleomorpha (strain ATCC BAA-1885 / DSM 22778 / Grapes) TaxID=158190 RepID=G8QTA5_SPHPG|nr:3-oxo-tetronate kinase [Sphaerochaeta pleomorpha]AEV29072.1 hypothetical protein SpiGrapes_1258 [Sphaerochaeta pleomorpha str. Grapes]
MRLGVIADDFTGATDMAGFLADNGMATVMFNGVPARQAREGHEAIVVSLKIRSCPVEEAKHQALEALRFLIGSGCTRFYYKYCSTFDSTHEGNIGPVIDALLEYLQISQTVICPSLPVNGRTVYQGYLFVHDQLLHESGMKNHPVTPMADAKLSRLMEGQSKGVCSHIFYQDIAQGPRRIRERIEEERRAGANYLIVDALNEQDLFSIAEATNDFLLLTGGSGLAVPLACQIASSKGFSPFIPERRKGVVIAGSCSVCTLQQVAEYKKYAPSFFLDSHECLHNSQYAREVASWVLSQSAGELSPLVYATTEQPDKAGNAGPAIEATFSALTKLLAKQGIQNFIVAGGETSAVVVAALAVEGFEIGPKIDPGVPWVRSLDKAFQLVLKSGNFGEVDFFRKAQKMTASPDLVL